MLTRLLINWPYKLAALLIAIALKWEVAETNHPHIDKRITVPVEINNVPSNLIVMDPTTSVDLLLSGTGTSLDSVSEMSYRASINLAGFHAGANQADKIDIEPTGDVPADVSIESVSPEYASVTLENDVKVKFRVGVTFDRVAPAGLSYGAATVRPPVASVEGPESSVNRIARLVVDGSDAVNGETVAPGMLDGFGPIVALDALQNPINDLSIMPPSAEVRVPVVRQAGVKEVLVNAVFNGRPPYPYEVDDVDVQPNAVTIQGSPDELGAYSVIKAAPIDLTNVTSDIQRSTPIDLPTGVTSVTPNSVTVTVHIGRMNDAPYSGGNSRGTNQ